MCKIHCIDNGGCSLNSHRASALSARQKGKRRAQEPIHYEAETEDPFATGVIESRTPDLYRRSESELIDEVLAEYGGPIARFNAQCVAEANKNAEEQRELDAALGLSLSPVPVEVELEQMRVQEEAELAQALAMSLTPDPNLAPVWPTLSTSLSIPTTTVIASNTASVNGQLNAGFPSSQASPSRTPRPRVAATSVVPRKRPVPMRITTQMNETWMRDLVDNTSAPRTTQSSRGRRPFADLSAIQRFTLIYWDKVRCLTMVSIVFINFHIGWGPCAGHVCPGMSGVAELAPHHIPAALQDTRHGYL